MLLLHTDSTWWERNTLKNSTAGKRVVQLQPPLHCPHPSPVPPASPRPPPALTRVFLAPPPRDFAFLPRCLKESFHFQENTVRNLPQPGLLSSPRGWYAEGRSWGREEGSDAPAVWSKGLLLANWNPSWGSAAFSKRTRCPTPNPSDSSGERGSQDGRGLISRSQRRR